MAQLREDDSNKQEPLVQEILSLGRKTLSKTDFQSLQFILTDETKKIQFVLSNIEEYAKVLGTKYIRIRTKNL